LKNVIAFMLLVLWCALVCSDVGAENQSMMNAVLDGKERVCLDCHRFPNINTNEGVLASRSMCQECHSGESCRRSVEGTRVSLQVMEKSFAGSPHKFAACIHCHEDVARSPHRSEKGTVCTGCHTVHGEGVLHDPHLRVQCQACHRKSEFVFLDKDRDLVRLARVDKKKMPVSLTDHALPDATGEEFCLRCHTGNNEVGAAASILPSKSFICMICHSAPLVMGHPMFWAAFLVFVAGGLLTLRFWFQGSVQGEEESLHRKVALTSESLWRTLFSREILPLIRTVILDVFLQRRMLQESVRRWFIHALIYLSILARLVIGLFTYYSFRISPDSGLALALIDKNHGFTAFAYDLLGLFILVGLVWAIIQRFVLKPEHVAREGQDNIAVGILSLLVIAGFFLEGARILMTQVPDDVAIYSFLGYAVAGLISFLDLDWRAVYPYLWYAHAVLGALFIAYLPFGKMKHIFNTPLTLLMNYRMK
jgi:nitrate reductase gamma subunit